MGGFTISGGWKPTVKDILLWLFRDGFLYGLLPLFAYLFLVPALFYAFDMPWWSYPASFVPFWLFALIPFLKEAKPGSNPASFGKQYEGWRDIQGPSWAYIFLNAEVGAMGDHTWPTNIHRWLGRKDSPLAMWYWLAIRNPINNLQQLIGQRITHGATIEFCGKQQVESSFDLKSEGWQLVKCTSDNKTTYSFFLVYRYPFADGKFCFRLRVGYKVKPDVKSLQKKLGSTDKVGAVFVPTFLKKYGE
jgi:hypothetical protein